MIEGEEEVGSVSLWDFVKANKARLKADALVVSDTGMLAKGVPSITYALRGLNYYEIEITGRGAGSALGNFQVARYPTHSPSLCPNLFAKLHDKNNRVAIPGFYDDVEKLSAAERKALNSLPWKVGDFKKAVGAPGLSGEKGFPIVEQHGSAADAGVEWHLGRLHGRGREGGESLPRRTRNFQRAWCPVRMRTKSRAASGRAAHPQAAAQNREN